MSTRLIDRGGGADRFGLDNILGTNNHPMNGLAYASHLLGGSLLGVLPLDEGRFACFFREYSYVHNGVIEQANNKVLIISTVSGNSMVEGLGIEDMEWASFDVSGSLGYLLFREDGVPKIAVLRADTDKVRLLSIATVPTATKHGGGEILFDHSVSVDGGRVIAMAVQDGEMYLSRVGQSWVNSVSSWEFLSDNTYRKSSEELRPQQATKGSLQVGEAVDLVDVGGVQYVFNYNDGTVTTHKKNRYGVWEQSSSFDAPEVDGDILGFCLVKGVPAYSEPKYRYTIPAVFSVDGEPITQHWTKASVN